MSKYETGGNNQESNLGENVEKTKSEAITEQDEQDEQDGKIFSDLMEEGNKKQGGKNGEILEKAEANSESDAVESLKELAKNLETPEGIKNLRDGLEDIGEKVEDDDLRLSKLKRKEKGE